jgi:hypothetical protein
MVIVCSKIKDYVFTMKCEVYPVDLSCFISERVVEVSQKIFLNLIPLIIKSGLKLELV